MLVFKALFLVFLSRGFHAQNETEYDNRPSLKIVGGQEALNGSFPFMASIRRSDNNVHICGGTIVDEKFILTAAHCFGTFNQPSDLLVYVGTNSLSSGGTSYTVSKIIIHLEYNSTKISNDIALLELSSIIEMSNMVNVVTLSSCLNETDSELLVTAIGWGYTFKDSDVSDTLQYVFLRTKSQIDCKSSWGSWFGENQLCTAVLYKGICFGDSGGPLMYDGSQIGISSFVDSNECASDIPDVYVNICKYATWIYSGGNLLNK